MSLTPPTPPEAHRITPDCQPELRQIPGYSLYSVTQDGCVFSSVTNRFLKSSPNKRGYPRIRLAAQRGQKQKTLEVYLLVAWAWIGPCPPEMEVAHADGNPANSHSSNLSYKTHKANMGDTIVHGTRPYGEKSGTVKIREADAIGIIRRVDAGEPVAAIAQELGLSKTHVRDIASGKKWKHLERKSA